jgi:ligand-binding sensor domain-containing protein
VGTAHGAARLTDSAAVIRIAPSYREAVYAVALAADTTWIGTPTGLFFTVSRDGDLLRPAGLGTVAAREPVLALAWLGETLVALTPERVISRDGRGRWQVGPVLSTQVGRLRAFTPDGNGMWVAGERGAGFARLDLPMVRPLLIGDLPGDPRDVAVDADHVWIATSAGLVRFRREAVGR